MTPTALLVTAGLACLAVAALATTVGLIVGERRRTRFSNVTGEADDA